MSAPKLTEAQRVDLQGVSQQTWGSFWRVHSQRAAKLLSMGLIEGERNAYRITDAGRAALRGDK